MKIFKALKPIYDINNEENIVKENGLVIFEDEERAENAVNKGLVEEVTFAYFKGVTNEEKKTENLKELTVKGIKEILDDKGIKYKTNDKKEDLLNKLK